MRTPTKQMSSISQRGFSLIELMIAMTIGLIVLAGVGYLYVESRQAFRSMDNLSRMQESARYALEVMARDIRMAGYRGCASSSVEIKNVLNSPTSFAHNFSVPINGFEGSGMGWSPALPTGAGGLDTAKVEPGTDAFTLRGAFGGGTTITAQPGGTSADLKVTPPHDLAKDDIVLASTCEVATAFNITNINIIGAGQNVVHNEGVGSPGNSTKDLGAVFVGGELLKMQTKSYFIRESAISTPSNKRFSLWQFDNHKASGGDNPAEIADGIENMQILYGSDANSDGIVESYSKADVVPDWKKVAAVRISLLVAGNDNVASGKQKYTYDGAAVEAGDLRLRQVFTTTVSLRNKTQ